MFPHDVQETLCHSSSLLLFLLSRCMMEESRSWRRRTLSVHQSVRPSRVEVGGCVLAIDLLFGSM